MRTSCDQEVCRYTRGASYFALPLAVRCEHTCGVALGLEVQQIGGDAVAQCWTPQIKFKHRGTRGVGESQVMFLFHGLSVFSLTV